MDLTWLPTVTVGIVASLATLGGVWINAAVARRVEDARQNREDAREQKRLDRDEAVRRAEAQRLDAEDAAAVAADLKEMFAAELRLLQKAKDMKRTEFVNEFTNHVIRTGVDLRGQVNRVLNPAQRLQLVELIAALSDLDLLLQLTRSRRGALDYAEWMLTIGFDLSSAAARGQAPDSEVSSQYEQLRFDVGSVTEYINEQIDIQSEFDAEHGGRAPA